MPAPRVVQTVRSKATLRVAVLLLVLSAVAIWASSVVVHRKLRREWKHTLHVAVVVLGPGGVSTEKTDEVRLRLVRLTTLVTREFHRYRPEAPLVPAEFVYVGAVGVEEPPPMAPESDGLIARAKYAYRLAKYFDDVHKRGEFDMRGFDARIYIMTEPAKPSAARFVEGIGTLDGDVGVVQSQLDLSTLDLTLVAVAHEFLHCLGATDKYDDDGHSRGPQGLPEPDLKPLYPQRFAEVMVGEVAMSPSSGRLPATLDEVAVGPVTAREIGWIKGEDGRSP